VFNGDVVRAQLASGRLIVPAYHSQSPKDDGELSAVHIMQSDDLGETWTIGAPLSLGLHFPNEVQAVQLPDQSVFIHARGLLTSRIGGITTDFGNTWQNVTLLPGLVQPLGGCEGSTISVPELNVLVYAGLSETTVYRYNLTLFTAPAATPMTSTWTPRLVLEAGPSAYNALTVIGTDLGVLYEWSNRTLLIFEPDAISFVRVPLKNLV
jgi:hypothetical protein